MKFGAGNFYGSELAQVIRNELNVQQCEAAFAKAFDKIDKRDLAGVGFFAEHAFAEKDAAKGHTVKPTDKPVVLPAFDAMGVVLVMQGTIKSDNRIVDPTVRAFRRGFRAGPYHRFEGPVEGDMKRAGLQGPSQPLWNVELIKG